VDPAALARAARRFATSTTPAASRSRALRSRPTGGQPPVRPARRLAETSPARSCIRSCSGNYAPPQHRPRQTRSPSPRPACSRRRRPMLGAITFQARERGGPTSCEVSADRHARRRRRGQGHDGSAVHGPSSLSTCACISGNLRRFVRLGSKGPAPRGAVEGRAQGRAPSRSPTSWRRARMTTSCRRTFAHDSTGQPVIAYAVGPGQAPPSPSLPAGAPSRPAAAPSWPARGVRARPRWCRAACVAGKTGSTSPRLPFAAGELPKTLVADDEVELALRAPELDDGTLAVGDVNERGGDSAGPRLYSNRLRTARRRFAPVESGRYLPRRAGSAPPRPAWLVDVTSDN